MMAPIDVLIIGAGISGLLCGTELQKAGKSVCILDKGRGLGGRMATRRMGAARLDHGAQFFTVRDPKFQCYVDEWLNAGVLREWFWHAPYDLKLEGYPRYCGNSGMTDVPKYLAQNLDVRRSEKVELLRRDDGVWHASTATGVTYHARSLVITAPLPQALELLDTSGLDYAGDASDALRRVQYERGLATLAVLDGPSGLVGDGFLRLEGSYLSWLADNQMKGISPDQSCVTIHASAEFAEKYWDSLDDVRGALMLDLASEYLSANVLDFSCHRWGFTQPINPYPQAYFYNPEQRLALAGDAFGGARIEGAALSGLAVASVFASC